MAGSYLVYAWDISGIVFKSCLGLSVRQTEVVSDCLWVHVRGCCIRSVCVIHVVSCQGMLTCVGAMSGDVREFWDRCDVLGPCKGILWSADLCSGVLNMLDWHNMCCATF